MNKEQLKHGSALKHGTVCGECGRTMTEAEYSCGESSCCKAEVVPEEEYGKTHDKH